MADDPEYKSKGQLRDFSGYIPTVSAIPTYIPKNFSEQMIIYVSGATLRLYIYDFTNNAWLYTALT